MIEREQMLWDLPIILDEDQPVGTVTIRHPDLAPTKTHEWATPQWLFDWANSVYGPFDLDVAASEDNAKCKRYFNAQADGLTQVWAPHNIWCNPPYGRAIGDWVRKAVAAVEHGARVTMLLPARTDTHWWHGLVHLYATEILLFRGRIHFGQAKHSAPFPSCLAWFGRRRLHGDSARVLSVSLPDIKVRQQLPLGGVVEGWPD